MNIPILGRALPDPAYSDKKTSHVWRVTIAITKLLKSEWGQEGIKFCIMFEDYWAVIPTILISK